jgi:tRNA threonylcarbamoyladenosine modification (KEOPS) complex Cgi121 subunit
MLHHLEDYGKYVEITGYRAINFSAVEAYLKAHRKQAQTIDVQFFDADLIATPQHLYFAALNALQAFRGKTNISKTLAMETILYASARRQIQKAIEQSGIKLATKNMAVLVIGENQRLVESALAAVTGCVGKSPDDSVLELNPDKIAKIKAAFGISELELKTVKKEGAGLAVADLVVERVALLATQL